MPRTDDIVLRRALPTRPGAWAMEEMECAAAHGANLGLRYGNLRAIAALKPSEVVVDLGCGAGFDCFLAAAQVDASAGRSAST